MKSRPRFYFSFRSPYSWIGARLLEERCDPVALGIEYIPFWEPDAITSALLAARGGSFLYVPMTRQKHLYILQDIKRLTTGLGYQQTWPVDENPWWDLPHLAWLAARHHGRGPELFWAIHRARWEEGADVCTRETIRRLAEELGLPPDEIAAAPEDPALREEGAAALHRAYRDDVFGMPFFIAGRDKFWGVDRLEGFLARLDGREPAAEKNVRSTAMASTVPMEACATVPQLVAESVGALDIDTAGGCG